MASITGLQKQTDLNTKRMSQTRGPNQLNKDGGFRVLSLNKAIFCWLTLSFMNKTKKCPMSGELLQSDENMETNEVTIPNSQILLKNKYNRVSVRGKKSIYEKSPAYFCVVEVLLSAVANDNDSGLIRMSYCNKHLLCEARLHENPSGSEQGCGWMGGSIYFIMNKIWQ